MASDRMTHDATRSTAVAQADDVRLLLKAITGCARCDDWSASRISTG